MTFVVVIICNPGYSHATDHLCILALKFFYGESPHACVRSQLYGWLSNTADSFLRDYSELGSSLGQANQFVTVHEQMQRDVTVSDP